MKDPLLLNPVEFVKTVGEHHIDDTEFRIRIPRWMIDTDSYPKRINYNNNIFVNASDCKVYPSSSVTTQNYITVPKTPNCDLSSVSVKVGDEYIVPDNTSVVCTCFYGRHAYLTDVYHT